MGLKNFERLKNLSSWRKLSIATWRAPNDPTVYGQLPIDFTACRAYLEKINKDSDIKITVTHLVAKAVALALRSFPDLNGIIRWRRIYIRKTVDISLQVAIEQKGRAEKPDLSAAKVENCDEKSLQQIARELKKKSESIRTGNDPQFRSTLRMLDLLPPLLLTWAVKLMVFLTFDLGLAFPRLGLPRDPFGSAMVTSVGMLRVPSGFAPLVPLSRVPIIVCAGEVKDQPWVIEGQLVVRPVLDLSFTFDHRFIDGLTGSRMANYLRGIIENPDKFF
ncbi:MAG: 2-oxo acid dehydrogenase subunit E2 [Deltaproteobacteria bacterium]|nr:2-oxo acid dehydrogenase subunit E2 [Deltaproteobacteria bacterium]